MAQPSSRKVKEINRTHFKRHLQPKRMERAAVIMSDMCMLSHDESVDRFRVMHVKEESCYSYRHFLPVEFDRKVQTHLNITWREKICQWSYNVVDHFDLSREVVAISLSLFDRYLATCGNKCNGNMALLTSLTTLQIAIKLHDSKKIKISTLANLSRGQFGPQDIEEMEWKIIMALNWKLHPPTQYAFVSHLLLFLPVETNSAVRKDLLELSRYLTELAICDSYFVAENNSTVAFAAVLNVMDEMNYTRLSAGTRERFLLVIRDSIGLQHRSPRVVAARQRLKTMFSASSGQRGVPSFASQQETNNENDSSSMAGNSMSSAGSNISSNNCSDGRYGHRTRANSFDSVGSCRYSPSPAHRRCVLTSVSPLAASHSRLSSSPMVAGVQ